MLLRLETFACCHVHVRYVDQGDAGREGLFHALGEDLGGDAGVREMAVEETGGAGYLGEGEAATLAGQPVDRLEHIEPQGDQLLEPPADLVHGEAHGLIQAGYLGHLDEALGTLAQAPDGVLVEVAPRGDARERHPPLLVLVTCQGPQLPLAPERAWPDFLVADEGAWGVAARVVGDLARHPRRLGRVDVASYLDPPAYGAGVQSL